MKFEDGYILRIYIRACDKKDGIPTYQWLVRQAKKLGIIGATVLRGLEGFGTSNEIRKSGVLNFTYMLPVIVEIADSKEMINKLLPQVVDAVTTGAMSLKEIKFRSFDQGKRL